MGLTHMLDTNICVALMKFVPRDAGAALRAISDSVGISTIVYAELRYGMENSSRPISNAQTLSKFVELVEVVPFGPTAAEHYGAIRTDLQRVGRPIGSLDMLIAAHARSEGLILITNNRREFDRVPGLRVENWLSPP
jgi:tRNA(fMet)-specific endonuclease VapC